MVQVGEDVGGEGRRWAVVGGVGRGRWWFGEKKQSNRGRSATPATHYHIT